MNDVPCESAALQELEVLEKFLKETPRDLIIAAADYIFTRVKFNIEKAQNTNEEYVIPRFFALLKKAETICNSDFSPMIIYMEDQKFSSGGLCDKLCHICWLYLLSKLLNCDFKICFTGPFNLSCYLAENKHKWLINKEDITKSEKKIAVTSFSFVHSDIKIENMENMVVAPQRFVQAIGGLVNEYERILCYFHINEAMNNVAVHAYFKEMFFELFSPSQKLHDSIDANLKKIDGEFAAAHFRFQKLLGDFSEYPLNGNGNCKTLDEEQKAVLIERCINILQKIAERNNGLKILVCSDSVVFLKAVKNLDFVFVVSGGGDRIKHIAIDQEIDDENILKLFTDLFLMSRAKRIYKVVEGDMYEGRFASTAARLGKTEYWTVKNGIFEPLTE
jgi:hypothetical protein